MNSGLADDGCQPYQEHEDNPHDQAEANSPVSIVAHCHQYREVDDDHHRPGRGAQDVDIWRKPRRPNGRNEGEWSHHRKAKEQLAEFRMDEAFRECFYGAHEQLVKSLDISHLSSVELLKNKNKCSP